MKEGERSSKRGGAFQKKKKTDRKRGRRWISRPPLPKATTSGRRTLRVSACKSGNRISSRASACPARTCAPTTVRHPPRVSDRKQRPAPRTTCAAVFGGRLRPIARSRRRPRPERVSNCTSAARVTCSPSEPRELARTNPRHRRTPTADQPLAASFRPSNSHGGSGGGEHREDLPGPRRPG